MHRNAPILLRDICVSFNMELFCRTNIKPRNALPVMLDCSQYGGSRLKKYRPCHGLCVYEVIARFVGVLSYTVYKGILVGASPSDK